MPKADHSAFDSFVDTVAKLRSPDGGCPWNRAQTHASLGDYMIEEAYETLDAIESGDADHLREELLNGNATWISEMSATRLGSHTALAPFAFVVAHPAAAVARQPVRNCLLSSFILSHFR